MANELPIMVKGGQLVRGHRDRKGKRATLSRSVILPSRGVWFIWLKVTNPRGLPARLTWDLDGEQPLHSSRSEVLIQPYAKAQWVSYSRYASSVGFKIQVNVDEPGKHTLNLNLVGEGEVRVDRIALTLYFNARPTANGNSLDHAGDPGRGRANFPESRMSVDGFRSDWKSPAIKATGKTYHVDSEKGDDGSSGLSPKRAWKTFANVNGRKFRPGDAILLKRGGRWFESLTPKGNGRKDAWITIGAYGKGPRPYVKGRKTSGVSIQNMSYWVIQDLKVTADADGKKGAGGIVVLSGPGPQPKGIKILNCIAFDTAGPGIKVGCEWKDSEGYDGVVIENCLSFAHEQDGFSIHGTRQNGSRNAVIRHCTAHSCDGMAGMWIHCTQNGLIERSVGYNNAVYNIWTWNSINVTMRYCEAFRGRPPGASDDSGGFDIDWGCEACTIEYCYGHHNKGAGVLLMGSSHGEYLGFPKQTRYTLCRYNVFEHNGHGILIYNTFEFGKVYNNVSVSHYLNKPALELWGHPSRGDWPGQFPSDNEIVNNILVGVDGGHPLGVDDAAIDARNVLDYNAYWRTDGKKSFVRWGGERSDWRRTTIDHWETKRGSARPKGVLTTMDEYRDVSGWDTNGFRKKPGLKDIGRGGNGRLPLKQYRLVAGSPARGAGREVVLTEEWLAERRKYLTDTGAEDYGIPMDPVDAKVDYWGDKLDLKSFSIGAEK